MKNVMKSLAMLAAAAIVGCGGQEASVNSASSAATQSSPMLNLSHIECTADGQVDVHFVLLFWGNTTPPALTGTYNDGLAFGPTATDKHSGNVWHYDVFLPAGFIDIQSANVGSVNLHNPSEYAGTYNCGGGQCQATPPTAGLLCRDQPLGNPGAECGFFGLNPIGKDDGLSGLTFTATMDAFVAIVKSGTDPCGPGNSAYNIYVNVVAGQTLSSPGTQAISHVTYCGCPVQ